MTIFSAANTGLPPTRRKSATTIAPKPKCCGVFVGQHRFCISPSPPVGDCMAGASGPPTVPRTPEPALVGAIAVIAASNDRQRRTTLVSATEPFLRDLTEPSTVAALVPPAGLHRPPLLAGGE